MSFHVPVLERRNTDLGIGAALDFTSNSSNSSVVGPPETRKRESREKVSAWLRGDHERPEDPALEQIERLPHNADDTDPEIRRSLNDKLNYEINVAPVRNKVQCLLSFGEYSLFKKWKVLAEGDFIPFKPGPANVCEDYYEQKLRRKRRKVLLRDVRTLAITKNWLLMARLYRLYQVDKDAVVPGGVAVELRRLVPLRYLRVCVARPAARVIGIANQSNVFKQYQMLDKPTPLDGDPFMTWRSVLGQLRPNLNDDVLYLTLKTFDRWQRQHACRLTIHPGYQSQSGISLNDWQVKLGEKEPDKCRCDNKEPPPPPPPPKKEIPPPPPPAPPSDSLSSIEYVAGLQTSIGDSVPMTTSNAPSEIEGIQTSFGTNKSMSEIMEAPLSGSGSTSYSNTASGDALLNMDMPPPSAGRRRKSLKTIFRLGFLNAKSNKKKYKQDDTIPSPDSGPPPPSPGKRIVQRRMSRLEMNEPIEDIFSEVKFETIQKRPSTSNSAGHDVASSGDVSDDDDIIEDPEAILRSIMDKKALENDDNDNLVFDDAITPVANDTSDVISPGTREKEFLLPEADRNHMPLEPLCEESPTKSSEDDLR